MRKQVGRTKKLEGDSDFEKTASGRREKRQVT